jgi:hypothetical protein
MLTVQMRDSNHPLHGKVIDYEIVERTVGSREGNYSGSSQRMEVEAVKACIEHLGRDPRFWAYVHDKDTGVPKLIAEQGYMVELLDRNHALRAAFTRIFD